MDELSSQDTVANRGMSDISAAVFDHEDLRGLRVGIFLSSGVPLLLDRRTPFRVGEECNREV